MCLQLSLSLKRKLDLSFKIFNLHLKTNLLELLSHSLILVILLVCEDVLGQEEKNSCECYYHCDH